MQNSPYNPAATFWRDSFADAIRFEIQDSTSYTDCRQAVIDWLFGRRRWLPISEENYWDMLESVPPRFHSGGLYLAGELYSGDFYFAGLEKDGTWWRCLMTEKEARVRAAFPFAQDLPVFTHDTVPRIPTLPTGAWHLHQRPFEVGHPGYHDIYDADLNLIAHVNQCVPPHFEKSGIHNAHLLVAAPALRSALDRLQANPNDPAAHRQAIDALLLCEPTP